MLGIGLHVLRSHARVSLKSCAMLCLTVAVGVQERARPMQERVRGSIECCKDPKSESRSFMVEQNITSSSHKGVASSLQVSG